MPEQRKSPAPEQRPALEPRPVAPSDRLDTIDALRGLALFGVMAINLVFEFRVSIVQQFLPGVVPASALDRAVESALVVAFEMKAFALFSILFGVGLAIQFERLAGNPAQIVLLLRRLVVLLAIGLVHLILIWNGDILTEYAIAGLVALPFLFGPQWVLAMIALACLALYVEGPPFIPFPDAAWIRDHIVEANRAYGTGGFSEVLAFRIRELAAILPLHATVFFRTLSLFLMGAFIWRTGVLRNASTNRLFLFTVAAVGLVIGFGAIFAGAPATASLAPVVLALAYGALAVGVMTTSGGRMVLGWAAPLGRMAFTNYIAQSLIFGWVFYGYGLGLFGQVGVTAAFVFGVVVYVLQAVFSAWWLKRHRFGPLEWLWRSLMYGAPQQMLLRKAPT